MSYQERTTQDQGQGIDNKLATKTVLSTLESNPDARAFVEAAKSDGIAGVLAGPNLITAFIPKGKVDNASHYVVRRRLMVIDLKLAGSVKPLDGSEVPVRTEEGGIGYFGDQRIGRADVPCSNGVIHYLD
jgi:uncharacterized surface protein with fasciclin (FAS1) repeats